MTDYKNIFGKPVKFLATDPDNAEAEGQIWYNSTDGAFKNVLVGAAFSSGGPLSSPRNQMGGIGSTNSAAIAAGGGPSSDSEEYNGVGWTTTPSLNQSRTILGGSPSGSVTAGIVYGGQTGGSGTTQGSTENYDGTSWTEVNNLNTARSAMGAAGTASSNLAFGGDPTGVGAITDATESWNGISWTEVNNLNDNGTYLAGVGSGNDSALAIDGGSRTSASEQWDGTSWTSTPNTNLDIQSRQAFGTATSAIAAGGNYVTTVEEWNNTVWSTSPLTLSIAVGQGYGIGSASTNGLVFGGFSPSIPGTTGATEEYNTSINVITGAAFSSGGSLPVGKQGFGGAGTRSASLIFGGYIGGPGTTGYVATTEEYNGSSWSGGGAMPTSRSNPIGFGTQTAGVAFAGLDNVPVYISTGDHYDGSTWTATPNNYPSNATNASSCGTQTAGLAANGFDSTAYLNTSNEYDGTSWTAGGTVPVSWSGRGTGGIQTSAIIFGGTDGGSPFPASGQSQSDEYNGSTWTTVPSLTSGRIYPHGTGNTSADNVRSMGGRLASPAGTPTTEHLIYDGTVWSTQPSMTTARQQAGITVYSSTPEAMVAGGHNGSFVTATEEFTPETSALNIKTITTS